jgi:hypothetical protein
MMLDIGLSQLFPTDDCILMCTLWVRNFVTLPSLSGIPLSHAASASNRGGICEMMPQTAPQKKIRGHA